MRISDWSSDVCSSDLILQERLFANPKIEVVWNAAVDEVLGGGTPPGVTGVRVRDTISGSTSDIPADRSEERRVGKECVRTCRSRWSAYHQNTHHYNHNHHTQCYTAPESSPSQP